MSMDWIRKKDFQRLINETASGFKPRYSNSNNVPQTATQKAQQPIGQTNAVTAKPDYDKVELYDDPNVRKGEDWAKHGGNFAIKRNGQIFYVSKSATASLAALCMDKKHGVWCILANQRGPGAGSKQGQWNLPVGFVDREESAEDGAKRETYEETGVVIPKGTKLRLLGTKSNGSERISFAYGCVLNGSIEDYPVSDANCEPGEASDIKWIPVFTAGGTPLKNIVSAYQWDRNPEAIISRAETILMPYLKTSETRDNLIKRLKSEISENPTALYLLDKILSI